MEDYKNWHCSALISAVGHGITCDTPDIAFKAGQQEGREEVVRAVESFCPIIKEGMYGQIWQAFLKEKGLEP